jgi:hypothetical protein
MHSHLDIVLNQDPSRREIPRNQVEEAWDIDAWEARSSRYFECAARAVGMVYWWAHFEVSSSEEPLNGHFTVEVSHPETGTKETSARVPTKGVDERLLEADFAIAGLTAARKLVVALEESGYFDIPDPEDEDDEDE